MAPWHPQILTDKLTLSQPGEANYAHHITNGTPGFSDLPTALHTYCACRPHSMPIWLWPTSCYFALMIAQRHVSNYIRTKTHVAISAVYLGIQT